MPLLWHPVATSTSQGRLRARKNCPGLYCTICISRAMFQISGGCTCMTVTAAVIQTLNSGKSGASKGKERKCGASLLKTTPALRELLSVSHKANTSIQTRFCVSTRGSISSHSLTSSALTMTKAARKLRSAASSATNDDIGTAGPSNDRPESSKGKQRMPQLICFDLDYTLWPLWCAGLLAAELSMTSRHDRTLTASLLRHTGSTRTSRRPSSAGKTTTSTRSLTSTATR